MIEEHATVVAVTPDSIWVEAERNNSCGHCGSRASCDTSVLASLFGRPKTRLRLDNPGGIKTGDNAVIGIPDQILSIASLTAYLIPLIGMIVFAITSRGLGHSEITQAVAAVCGLILGLWLVGRITRSSGRKQKFAPVLIRFNRESSLSVEFNFIKESKND